MPRLSLYSVLLVLSLLLSNGGAANPRTTVNVASPSTQAINRLKTIDNFIVIMLENESFDQLFPDIPNTENLVQWIAGKSPQGIPYFQQTDVNGVVYTSLNPPLCSGVPCGNFTATIPNAPYLANQYWSEDITSSFDVTHRYYQEQWQINGGNMDHYVLWGGGSSLNATTGILAPVPTGWAMQYLGALAQNFTTFDHFFHSYFGGSTPGAVSVFHGDLPYYNGSSTGCPTSLLAAFNGGAPTTNGANFTVDGVLDFSCRMINDVYAPGFGTGSVFLPTNQTSIGDVLTAAGISWTWYAQNWNNAVAQAPAGYSTSHFAYHHHAPLYYQRFVNLTSPKWGQPEFTTYLQDELNFFSALQTGTGLPSVSYVRPSPDDDMHPAQNNPELAQAHLQQYFSAIFNSTYWASNTTMVLITFDENGGYFDHVPPYIGDADGPGTRIPVVVISPYHKNGGINSHPYENLSFLKLLQTRYNLSTNTIASQRVGTVRDLTNSFAEPTVASVSGDPQFSGFKGQAYQVHGIPGMVYAVLVSEDMLVNARFALIKEGESLKWHDMKVMRLRHEKERLKLVAAGSTLNASHASPLPITKAWTHTGTYLSEIGLRIADSTQRGAASIFLRAGGFPHGLQQATIDGEAMKLHQDYFFQTRVGSVSVTLTTPHTVRLDHPYLTLTFVNSDGFFNLEAGQLLSDAAIGALDGLLGQTADESWQPAKTEEIKESLIFDFLVKEGEQGIFSADFAKNRWAIGQ